jgi:hypothetical protein
MKKRTRFWVSLALGTGTILAYYAPLLAKGYVRRIIFPLIMTSVSLPHCPECDALYVHFTFAEIAFVTAIFYLLLSVYAWLRSQGNCSQARKESSG